MLDRLIDGQNLSELADEVLSQGGALRFRARGVSMRPFIQDGDVLEIKPVRDKSPRLGDVLLFTSVKGDLLAHRLVRTQLQSDSTVYILQGDSRPVPDEPVPPGSVLGRVVAVQHGERVVHIDRPVWRWLGLAWARLIPVTKTIYAFVYDK